jgi:hypothetical protein
MNRLKSIQKLDTAILYGLELIASVSIVLLAIGLVLSMANVLTQGLILTDNLTMKVIWAIIQCVAIGTARAGTIIQTFQYRKDGQRFKMWLYGSLSALLLFTAAIVSNIESVQQTLNITLAKAYIHVFVPVELLILIRSIAIVLLIVAHSIKHLDIAQTNHTAPDTKVVVEAKNEPQKALPAPKPDNFQRVKDFMEGKSDVTAGEVARALGISKPTASKWIKKVEQASTP